MKKITAGAAVAVSMLGFSAAVVPQAMATGNDHGTSTVNGNGARTAYGNSTTHGKLSTQLGLVQSSLNDLCLGVPVKANVGSLVGLLVPVAVQDVNVLSNPQNQQCTENSTQAKGDEPLSHILDDISALSANGERNS
ncbi:rodlin [Streptomyces benahoarensis]|uniref:RdlA protein n=1 Tax=Streptomyces benahoarensis TaxID=2595054 RepID=A0A553YWS5_9ACTN|nr:rodlin [Streptomyces benahoarensis]TSB17812.1 RdlA protein [Streptomyces benahoarensis]TSB33654.1 RdlA protein [Streptomyces benahoarensis]